MKATPLTLRKKLALELWRQKENILRKEHPLKQLFWEVRKADCFHLSFFICFFNIPIAFSPVVCRLMQEEQINVVRIKALQCFFDCRFFFIDCRPELRYQEDIFSIPRPVPDSFMYPLAVSMRRTPLFNALSTAFSASAGDIINTPIPAIGILIPLFSVKYSILFPPFRNTYGLFIASVLLARSI